MIDEFRIYRLHPGKLDAFKLRFEQHSKRLFARHGIELIGFWVIGQFPKDSVPEKSAGGIVRKAVGSEFGGYAAAEVAYMVRFKSLEQRDAAWSTFAADSEWIERRRESEIDGPLVASEESFLLSPTSRVNA